MIIKKLKNIKPGPLITHLVITLAYPAVKAFTVERNGLVAFTDSLTIVGLIMLVVGIVYAMNLHGDFDISRYYLQRGVRSFRLFAPRQTEGVKQDQDPADFLRYCKEKRANAFNYPLFLGILYVLASVVIAFVILS
ncbi:MAG: DUF3899 domain-containing protein [Clostridia bacterium]|nr:DUF3899 domain-containing protein [Clostridia bacterium]MBQ2110338.1 DUF3899 domain-containing protein [Clostridia bacterium]MBQ3938136.1 DUF3899 domain-containing protein [Clostridia bacterium]MBQ5489005.1 DUF3899 domain-containing protein [Clostridia bacterium]MBR4635473.1 DUF3899 domain-containing protein [Clostridia bacterium]